MIFYKLFRWFNKLYAELNGYFWIPCPICSEYFGGHEYAGGILMGTLEDARIGIGHIVCPRCSIVAEEQTAKFLKTLKYRLNESGFVVLHEDR